MMCALRDSTSDPIATTWPSESAPRLCVPVIELAQPSRRAMKVSWPPLMVAYLFRTSACTWSHVGYWEKVWGDFIWVECRQGNSSELSSVAEAGPRGIRNPPTTRRRKLHKRTYDLINTVQMNRMQLKPTTKESCWSFPQNVSFSLLFHERLQHSVKNKSHPDQKFSLAASQP